MKVINYLLKAGSVARLKMGRKIAIAQVAAAGMPPVATVVKRVFTY